MRLVYSADLHGEAAAYRALLGLASTTRAEAVIVGGDLLPHAIKLDTALAIQQAFIQAELQPLLRAFRAQQPECAIYLLPGNDDWAAAVSNAVALEQEGLAYLIHNQVVQLVAGDAPLWLAGYACVPLTPFSIKDYERRDAETLPPFDFSMAYTSHSGTIEPAIAARFAALPSIADDMAALAQRSDPARTIYICHTPPANTPLDQMPRGRHVGSQALRAFIEQHTPFLTLHGHIHEAPEQSGQYAIRLGTTWCINPGHRAGRLQAVTLDTDDIIGTLEHTVFGRPSV
ncbi:MAG: metallophosphoesterase [Chloroflexi bacterium SZAS-1]|jgi:Icc-related predicted phosphoesterase|nr:metallophosphoesterase [Chloroflexi bacterium SZAS-1]